MGRAAVSRGEALRTRLRGAFAALEPRDRRALRIGGVALSVLAPLLLGWGLHDHLETRRDDLERSRALAAIAAQRTADRLAAGADLAAGAASEAALRDARITRALERAGLTPSLVTLRSPTADRSELVLRDAPFDAVASLLGSLARWEGITVVSAELTRTQPGRVDVSTVLRGP